MTKRISQFARDKALIEHWNRCHPGHPLKASRVIPRLTDGMRSKITAIITEIEEGAPSRYARKKVSVNRDRLIRRAMSRGFTYAAAAEAVRMSIPTPQWA